MDKEQGGKLVQIWQERLSKNQAAYTSQIKLMEEREALNLGTREIDGKPAAAALPSGKKRKDASVVRNIVAELIEAQVDSNIPQPKVTARHQGQEHLAKLIEDVLRNELDRLPMEMINDQDERTTPIQGGDFYLVEWDSRIRTHTTTGELAITLIHPKQVIPQNGIHIIEDMDYIIIQTAQSKEAIKRRYKVDVSAETEENPASRQNGYEESSQDTAEDIVTLNTAYYRNPNGGIGVFRWVNDIEVEHLEDYQARRLGHCAKCGAVSDGVCPRCGGKRVEPRTEDEEALTEDIQRSDGSIIPALTVDPLTGQPVSTRIPYYKPDRYPLILRKNVSVFGQFLGDSDIDRIRHQQDEIKKAATRIQEKLDTGGSILGLAKTARIELTDGQMRVVRFESPQEEAMTKVLNLQVDIGQDMAYLESNYESARQIIGVTDSFQGRKDPTATSGKAKEFAAAQTAGRLESKRVMKNSVYANLFELMFKFLLAYADEPRPISRKNLNGETEYGVFNKYDFLNQDAAGEWYWNDEFLFSVDTSAPLAANREAMWQETRMNLKEGAFGDPTDLRTLIMFWTKMDLLHYPGAKETKEQLQQILQERQQQEAAAMIQQQIPPGSAPMGGGMEQIPDGGLENVMPVM